MRITDTHRDLWRAGCVEMRTSGSGSGQGKPTRGDTGRAALADFHWQLMRDGEGAKFLFRMSKAARKRNAGLTVATQDAADVLKTDLGQAVVSNAATQLLLKQASQAIDAVGDAFGLTAGERRMLLSARTGTGLLISGTNRTAFEAVASSAEHALATTKPSDLYDLDDPSEEDDL
jgi:hypothetical protein